MFLVKKCAYVLRKFIPLTSEHK